MAGESIEAPDQGFSGAPHHRGRASAIAGFDLALGEQFRAGVRIHRSTNNHA
jgi:hypothetical protein